VWDNGTPLPWRGRPFEASQFDSEHRRQFYKQKFIKNKMKKITIFIIILFLALIIISLGYKMTGNILKEENTPILLETNQGNIIITLYNDMPITTGNFKNLVEQGIYDGVIFHRVINDFMIQGGDPTGTGYGDPSIPNIKDEFTHKKGNKNNRGTISMANAGPNTGSSQFFINLANNNFLDTKHPVFGEVTQGMDVVDKIGKVETNSQDKPLKEIIIIKASIL